jgi:hypothetical protein
MIYNQKKSLRMTTHKDTTDSAGMGTDMLGESVLPPQIIDNSAILFGTHKI